MPGWSGILSGVIQTPKVDIVLCGDKCPICLGTWIKVHMPVPRKSLIELFQSSVVSEALPMSTDLSECNSILEMLWGKNIGLNPFLIRLPVVSDGFCL